MYQAVPSVRQGTLSHLLQVDTGDSPKPKPRPPTPKQYRQSHHKERVRAQVSRNGKIPIERRVPARVLEDGEVGRLPADQW